MISELERIIHSYVNVIYGKNKQLYTPISNINFDNMDLTILATI